MKKTIGGWFKSGVFYPNLSSVIKQTSNGERERLVQCICATPFHIPGCIQILEESEKLAKIGIDPLVILRQKRETIRLRGLK